MWGYYRAGIRNDISPSPSIFQSVLCLIRLGKDFGISWTSCYLTQWACKWRDFYKELSGKKLKRQHQFSWIQLHRWGLFRNMIHQVRLALPLSKHDFWDWAISSVLLFSLKPIAKQYFPVMGWGPLMTNDSNSSTSVLCYLLKTMPFYETA